MQNKPPVSIGKIAIQSWLRQALSPVLGNCDFERFRQDLEKTNAHLRSASVETLAVEMALENLSPKSLSKFSKKDQ